MFSMKKRILLKPVFALVDIALLAAVFQVAYLLRFEFAFLPDRPIPSFELYFRFSFLVALIGFGMLSASGMYRLRHFSFKLEDFFAIFRAVTYMALIVMATNFVFRGYIAGSGIETYSRIIVLLAWLMSIIVLSLWRISCAICFKQLRRYGRGVRKVIIVGTDKVSVEFHQAMQNIKDSEYLPLGFILLSNSGESEHRDAKAPLVLGHVGNLADIIRAHHVSDVVLASNRVDESTFTQLVKNCEQMNVQFSMIPGFFEILTRQMSVHEVADIPLFQLEERIFQRWGYGVKRAMDIAIALFCIIAFSPFWVCVALVIRFTSEGGVFYNHERVGRGEKIFRMFKFRSMYANADALRKDMENDKNSDDPLLRVKNDERVTPVGRVLRRFSLDEIPQLLNVLRGEMSLVGPRPHIPSEVKHYKEWHRRKFDVLPGVTGLTQVSGRKDLSLDEMVRLDIYYIENWSPWLDMQILLKTIPAMVVGKGAY